MFLRNRYVLIFALFPAATCLGFATAYYFSSSQLSYTNPYKAQNLNQFLAAFFKEACEPGRYPALVVRRVDGCTYSFAGNGIVTQSGNDGPIYLTKSIAFSFASYSDKILKLKYRTEKVWIKNTDMLPDETGIIELDLSNFSLAGDKIVLRVLPYIAYENFLIKKIDTQPQLDFKKPYPFTTWGTILVSELLKLNGGGGSITPGQDFASFVTSSPSDAYSKLKLYFEDGRIFSADFNVFIYFSVSIFTSSALGELVPNSPLAKGLVSLESILGIIWLGLLAGVTMNITFGTLTNKD